jgi:hypothetical protein
MIKLKKAVKIKTVVLWLFSSWRILHAFIPMSPLVISASFMLWAWGLGWRSG